MREKSVVESDGFLMFWWGHEPPAANHGKFQSNIQHRSIHRWVNFKFIPSVWAHFGHLCEPMLHVRTLWLTGLAPSGSVSKLAARKDSPIYRWTQRAVLSHHELHALPTHFPLSIFPLVIALFALSNHRYTTSSFLCIFFFLVLMMDATHSIRWKNHRNKSSFLSKNYTLVRSVYISIYI